MKIIQINETCGTSSIGRMVAELAEACRKLGDESYVFFASGNPTYKNSIRIGNRTYQKLHAIWSRISGKQGYASYIPTIKLLMQLNKIQPDIVHLHNLHANYINLGMLLKHLARKDIATVITLHDCWFYTGKCTYYVPAHCTKWTSGCGKCPLLHLDNVNPTFYFDTTHRCLKDKEKWFTQNKKLGVVGVSQWVTEEARKSIYQKKDITCIYNWVNQDVFYYRSSVSNAHLELPERKIVLMVSANLSMKKGYRELVFLAENLSSEYQIVYIGRNKQELKIPPNVIHIAHTDSENQLAEFYSIADVCVNTTQYETFGMVTAEAISCGTPVIVYNNTASPELVGEGCGIVINEMSEILDAISKITNLNRAVLRRKCINWAREKFNMQKSVKEYIEFYKELIGKDE